MSSIEHRRRAWAALKLGPLWQPIAGALPHAPTAPSSSGTAENDEAWLPGGEQEMSEEVWQQMAAEAAYHASSAPLPVEPMLESPDSGDVAHPPSASDPATVRAPTPPARPDRSLPDEARWQQLREAVGTCQRCGLADTRQNTVFGRGREGRARWMLIGEAPGAEEDRRGEAFVGQAGQLLDAMLSAAGIDPATEVFIANVLKCRPPGNRNPELYEVNQCEGYLHEQIRLADPACILLLGRFAAQSVLNSSLSINRLRSRVHHIRLAGRDVPVVCTFHPAYLLRNPLDKLKSWEDLCLARSVLDRPGQEKLPLPARRSTAR
ncbi:MAG: uracil-DNA glycosylase family protein [Lautropia sp.]|nr:uracil-DNA glycosylase family protein [Lautropia sp.]